MNTDWFEGDFSQRRDVFNYSADCDLGHEGSCEFFYVSEGPLGSLQGRCLTNSAVVINVHRNHPPSTLLPLMTPVQPRQLPLVITG